VSEGDEQQALPFDGRPGDLLALIVDGIGATLWFCGRGRVSGDGALWGLVAVARRMTDSC
jgi:hypothetical protein